ncbi:MAG: hypothetical protein JWO11_4144 [Nocardioides sp.]|nr:hypothetical protein [Nocardioides sp.]
MDELLTEHADKAGRPFGMTADQVVAYIAMGDRMHGDARPGECGAVDPRKESQWCREAEGHTGAHSPVASPRGVCGVSMPPYDPYTYCGLPVTHLGHTPHVESLNCLPGLPQ